MSKRAMLAAKELGLEVGLALAELDDSPSWAGDGDFVIQAPLLEEGAPKSFGLIGAALDSGCDALFPTFADENQCLALSSLSAASRISFIGGNPQQLETLMNRVGMRWAAIDLNMDVVTTSEKITTIEDALFWIARLNFPLVLRTLREPSKRLYEMDDAKQKIEQALVNGPIVLERLVADAREIETVMFAVGDDGLPVCLGEVEIGNRISSKRGVVEFPPVQVTEQQLQKVRVQAAKLIVGTRWSGIISARFLVTPDGRAYFLQLNPGLQPWHAAVESALEVDLYEALLRVSMGEELGWKQNDVRFSGHTLSLLIYAQTSGRISALQLPTDCTLHWGPVVGDFVVAGSLMGAVSIRGGTRQTAIVLAKVLLDQLTIAGVDTNIPDLLTIFNSKKFWSAPVSRDINPPSDT